MTGATARTGAVPTAKPSIRCVPHVCLTPAALAMTAGGAPILLVTLLAFLSPQHRGLSKYYEENRQDIAAAARRAAAAADKGVRTHEASAESLSEQSP